MKSHLSRLVYSGRSNLVSHGKDDDVILSGVTLNDKNPNNLIKFNHEFLIKYINLKTLYALKKILREL